MLCEKCKVVNRTYFIPDFEGFFSGNSQQNHSTYQVNYTPADNAACCLTLILLSRSTLKIKA